MADENMYPYAYGNFGQHHYHRHDQGCNDGVGVETLILANQIAAGDQAIGDKIHTASVNGIKETSQSARDTVDAVRDGITATNQIGNINLQSTERNGGETRSSVERTAGETRDAVNFAANQTARDFAGVARDLCDGRREVSQGFGDVKLEMCKQHAELARQADANAAALAKQLAECCCETKELVRAENAATRQLIQQHALDDCNRRASDLQNEVNMLRLGAGGNGPGPFAK